jgi:hypothetical protein
MAKQTNGDSSVLERLKALDEERRQLTDRAVTEAMELANSAIETLKSLGRTFHLVEGETRGRRASSGESKGRRQANPDRPCPICGFKTEPPHDARRHRGQDPKRPFTNAELEANHMKRV